MKIPLLFSKQSLIWLLLTAGSVWTAGASGVAPAPRPHLLALMTHELGTNRPVSGGRYLVFNFNPTERHIVCLPMRTVVEADGALRRIPETPRMDVDCGDGRKERVPPFQPDQAQRFELFYNQLTWVGYELSFPKSELATRLDHVRRTMLGTQGTLRCKVYLTIYTYRVNPESTSFVFNSEPVVSRPFVVELTANSMRVVAFEEGFLDPGVSMPLDNPISLDEYLPTDHKQKASFLKLHVP